MNYSQIEHFKTRRSSTVNYRLPGQTEEQYRKRINRSAKVWVILGGIVGVIFILFLLYVLIKEGPEKAWKEFVKFFN